MLAYICVLEVDLEGTHGANLTIDYTDFPLFFSSPNLKADLLPNSKPDVFLQTAWFLDFEITVIDFELQHPAEAFRLSTCACLPLARTCFPSFHEKTSPTHRISFVGCLSNWWELGTEECGEDHRSWRRSS